MIAINYVGITKVALRMTMAAYATQFTKNQIINHTEVDPDSKLLQVGSYVVGSLVSDVAGHFTDLAIDKALDEIAERKERRAEAAKPTVVPTAVAA
jgi:hypothetical protein